MVVASVVLYALTIAVMLWLVWRVELIADELVSVTHDTIETEVRRQDERLEKRRQRASGQEPDMNETEPGQDSRVVSGRPMRR